MRHKVLGTFFYILLGSFSAKGHQPSQMVFLEAYKHDQAIAVLMEHVVHYCNALIKSTHLFPDEVDKLRSALLSLKKNLTTTTTHPKLLQKLPPLLIIIDQAFAQTNLLKPWQLLKNLQEFIDEQEVEVAKEYRDAALIAAVEISPYRPALIFGHATHLVLSPTPTDNEDELFQAGWNAAELAEFGAWDIPKNSKVASLWYKRLYEAGYQDALTPLILFSTSKRGIPIPSFKLEQLTFDTFYGPNLPLLLEPLVEQVGYTCAFRTTSFLIASLVNLSLYYYLGLETTNLGILYLAEGFILKTLERRITAPTPFTTGSLGSIIQKKQESLSAKDADPIMHLYTLIQSLNLEVSPPNCNTLLDITAAYRHQCLLERLSGISSRDRPSASRSKD